MPATVEVSSKHKELELNNASIFHTMERFIDTVREMEDTILFPSRLQDLTMDGSEDSLNLWDDSIRDSLTNTDLYHLFKSISQMKVDLMCSRKTSKSMGRSVSEPGFKYNRSQSSASMQSVQSASTFSDSESDILAEIDSGAENDEQLNAACKLFKRHLHELNSNIEKLTSIAEYIISRYQLCFDNKT